MALALAALLPIVLFASAIALVVGLREQHALEMEALGKVREIAESVDRFIAVQLEAAAIMSRTNSLQRGDLTGFREFAERMRKDEPGWTNVILLDRSGERLIDLAQPIGAEPPRVGDAGSFDAALTRRASAIGNLAEPRSAAGAEFVPISVPVLDGGEIRYVLTIDLDPNQLSKLFEGTDAPDDWLGAIVDRNGRLLARTVRAGDYVGQSATPPALEAVSQGKQGVYEGRSLDGRNVVTAFFTSPLTGWTVHYAVPRSTYEAPLRRIVWIVVLFGLIAAMLAVVLFTIIGREAARRRRVEVAQIQSQKLEALGQFTSGIAHDFNNLLMAIMGNLEVARDRLGGHAVFKYVDRALVAANRGAALNAQLLAFARAKPLEAQIGSLNDIVEGTIGLIRGRLGSRIICVTDLQGGLWRTLLDATQLEVALINLSINARDAMPGGGTITISTRNFSAGDPFLRAEAAKEVDHVMLEVRDNGAGMSEEVRARAMEPFFTTKPVGKGTGLGLSQIHGVVSQLGGTVAIESAPGSGTAVRLFLPRAPAAPDTVAKAAPSPAETSAVASSRSRVLVVDDDRDVRVSAADMLRSLGHEVLEAATGGDALEVLERDAGIDVVVTDYAMAEMNGGQLAQRIRQRWPAKKIVLMTGYAGSIAEQIANTALLEKPFSLEQLAQALEPDPFMSDRHER